MARSRSPSDPIGTPIVFFVRLDRSHWNVHQAAWQCSALRIPAVECTELRTQAEVISEQQYSVDKGAHLIRWIRGEAPEVLDVRLEVAQALVTAQDAADNRKESNARVALIGAVATVVTAIISGVVAPSVRGSDEPVKASVAAVLPEQANRGTPPAAIKTAPPSAPTLFAAQVTYDDAAHVYRPRFAPGSPAWIEQVALGQKAGSYTLTLDPVVANAECTCAHPVASPAYSCSAETKGPLTMRVQTLYKERPSSEPFSVRCRKH